MAQLDRHDPVAAVSRFLEHVGLVNDELNVFVSLTPEETIRREALASTERWQSGRPLSALDGVLVSAKDNIARAGEPCRLGSAARSANPAAENAPAMARMLAAGMIVVGRTTMPDHGCKGVTHGGLHGTTRNPWNPALTPGGSSGGAAASVAAGLTRVALGSDGGGSIRVPAAFTGIVGLKPSFGRVPVAASGAFGSIGHQGPMGARVEDVAALFDVIKSDGDPWDACGTTDGELDGLRFSVWSDSAETDPAIIEAVDRTASLLTSAGAVQVLWETDLSTASRAFEVAFSHGAARAVSDLPEDAPMDPVLKALAERGRALSPHEMVEGDQLREQLRDTVEQLFEEVDIVLSPVTECLAFEVEHEYPPGTELGGQKWAPWKKWAPWTYPFNLTGNPAISLPAGLSASGLPIGVQLVTALDKDEFLLRVAHQIERRLGRLTLPKCPQQDDSAPRQEDPEEI